jgi:hypothetical protein
MAYDLALADRIRLRIGNRPDLVEKEMFGGIAFLVGGNMAVGVSGDSLMVRVGKDGHDAAMTRPGTRIFDMSGRPMRGWIVVDPIGFSGSGELGLWIDEGVAHALTLPRKGG